ncbi:MAG: ornithine carbamoyltransferase [Chloroflexi bacterium]|nr:ornithine carbamoyltransferase [Chloroflexota bacterium]
MEGKDLLSIADLTAEDAWRLLRLARDLKQVGARPLLAGRSLALVFEKPSLRTRVSFDVAMYQLGGHAIYLGPTEVGLGQRESVTDAARVLSRFVNGIVARTFKQSTIEELARYATVPVINALSDEEHPCQALGDVLTVWEHKGDMHGVTLAYVGDGNNVANSLLYLAALMGVHIRLASPPGYEVQPERVAWATAVARQSGASITLTADPEEAARGADVLYTDVWTSMGQEEETAIRRVAFARYQIDQRLLSLARPDALVMHPLPAHHGEEVAPGIVDSPQSVVFDQAENRLHIQKAILAELLTASP